MRPALALLLALSACVPRQAGDERLDRIEDLCREAVRGNQAILAEVAELKAAQAKHDADHESMLRNVEAPPKAAPSRPGRPDADTVYAIPLGVAPGRGATEPKVVIVEWSDFQCPFCKRADDTMRQVLERFPNEVRHVYRHNPLPFHTQAMPAAIAAEAARRQGRFWEMHDALFEITRELSDEKYEEIGRDLQLSIKRFRADVADPKAKQLVQADMAAAATFGARGTPTFFVNGRVLKGAQPFDRFREMIEEEIVRADALLKKGVARKDLYRELTKDGKSKVD